MKTRKPALKQVESVARLRAALLDRGMLSRFPAKQFSPNDEPRLFPFVENFSPAEGCSIDIVWIDQHGFLTLMGIVADSTRPAQQETIERLIRCQDVMWSLPAE